MALVQPNDSQAGTGNRAMALHPGNQGIASLHQALDVDDDQGCGCNLLSPVDHDNKPLH